MRCINGDVAYLRDFDKEVRRLFGKTDPTHFQAPCFGSPIDFTRMKLSSEKQETFKKLLCVIGHAHPKLEYAPIIPAIVAVLCKFLEPKKVLACMAALIEGHSIAASKREDWAYFPLHQRDYLVFERVFEDLVKTFASKVHRQLMKIQIVHREFIPAWDRVLSGLFTSFLPCELVFRIFDLYIVEGYKVLLRFAIAHVMVRQDRLATCDNPASFNSALISPVDPHDGFTELYFKTATLVKFSRSLIQRYRNRRRKNSIENFDVEDRILIFQRPLPHLVHKSSSFMKDSDWAVLWSWIPPRFRLLNLGLTFTTAEHGRHILTLFDRCRESEPLLMLIETVSGKVIGAYISKSLTNEHGQRFYGTGETFIFSISPTPFKYDWKMSSGNMAFTCATDKFIAFGTGEDFGLWIDKFLTRVSSGASTTFGNKPLLDSKTPDDLCIYCMEIFRFI